MKKLIQSTFTAIALGLLLSIPYAAPIDAAVKIDDTLNPMTIAKLPTCNSNSSGSRATISDFSGTATWNGAVGVGGGTGTASVYCDGGSWKIAVGGGGNSSTAAQNVAMAAPTTTLGNYATGSCTGTPFINDGQHNCLTFDDHWTSASLDAGPTGHWFEGLEVCNNNGLNNNNGLSNCGIGPGGDANGNTQIFYPFSAFCLNFQGGAINGCEDAAFYDFPYGFANNISNTGNMLSQAADGSLDLKAIKSAFLNGNGTYCNLADPACNAGNLDWLGSVIGSGGLNSPSNNRQFYPSSIAQASALIPYSGGMMQWRMKLDDGVTFGGYPGVECDPEGPTFPQKGNDTNGPNANFEFGYNNGNTDATGHWFGFSIGNVANGNAATVTTGDISTDGRTASTASGDVRNWHKYALEWTGSQWNYYVDNVRVRGPTTPVSAPGGAVGFYCNFSSSASYTGQWINFRTIPDGVHNGPFHMFISDVQFYKKPGT